MLSVIILVVVVVDVTFFPIFVTSHHAIRSAEQEILRSKKPNYFCRATRQMGDSEKKDSEKKDIVALTCFHGKPNGLYN